MSRGYPLPRYTWTRDDITVTPASRLTSAVTPASRLTSAVTPASRLTSAVTPASRLTSAVTPASRLTSAGGNLVLNPVTEGDTGSYVCTATNGLGVASSRVVLTVTSPLSVHVTPAQQTVDTGRDAAFNCSVYGGPVSHVTWLHNGRLLTSAGRVTLPTPVSLLVSGVTRADRGVYQCVVRGVTSQTGRGTAEALGAAQLQLGGKICDTSKYQNKR